MKINELITESQQIDEISAMDVARGIGSVAGKTAHAAGAVAGGLKGAWDAGKAGYQQGLSFTGGQRIGRTTPRAASSTAAPGGNLDAMADQDLEAMKSKIDSVLASRKGGSAPAGGSPQPAAPAAPSKPVRGQMANVNGKDYMFAGNMWVDEKNNPAKGEDLKQIKDMFARGEIGPPPTERPTSRPAAAGAQSKQTPVPSSQEILKSLAKLKPDQVEAIRDMLTAKVQGQQNVAEGVGSAVKSAWNAMKNIGGMSFDAIKKAIEQMTPDDAKNLLAQLPAAPSSTGPAAPARGNSTQAAASPMAGPATTQTVGKSSGGVGQNIGAAAPSLGAPTLKPREAGYVTTKIPGQTTAAPDTPKAAPAAKTQAAPASPYGKLTPDEQAFVAAREKEGVEPETIKQALANRRNRKPVGAPQGGPEKTQAKRTTDYDWYNKGGVNPSTKLSALGPVGAAARKTAANEGFYSKFLGKDI